eukprot:scaffold75367_cov18-Tisochrysis_lutea.AAC.2
MRPPPHSYAHPGHTLRAAASLHRPRTLARGSHAADGSRQGERCDWDVDPGRCHGARRGLGGSPLRHRGGCVGSRPVDACHCCCPPLPHHPGCERVCENNARVGVCACHFVRNVAAATAAAYCQALPLRFLAC